MPQNDFAVEIFAKTRHVVWVSAILQTLSEDCWTAPQNVRSLFQIEESFNEQVDEAMDNKRFVLSDPDCVGYFRAAANPDEHP